MTNTDVTPEQTDTSCVVVFGQQHVAVPGDYETVRKALLVSLDTSKPFVFETEEGNMTAIRIPEGMFVSVMRLAVFNVAQARVIAAQQAALETDKLDQPVRKLRR